MGLTAGTRLGPYEILTLMGAGGMREVYRAKHTKSKRDAAVKLLPDAFTADPERMARFQRDAEALACLNHLSFLLGGGLQSKAPTWTI